MSPRLITVTAILGAALVLSISLSREPLFRAVIRRESIPTSLQWPILTNDRTVTAASSQLFHFPTPALRGTNHITLVSRPMAGCWLPAACSVF